MKVKRKKTEDMPDSPPKRVTRARAKVINDTEPKTKVTKITTASAKVATGKRQIAETTKVIKPITKVNRKEMDSDIKAQEDDQKQKETDTTSVKPKRLRSDIQTKHEAADCLQSNRIRRERPEAPENKRAEAPKPRGRPRKAPALKEENPSNALLSEVSGPVKRPIRARAVTKPTSLASSAKTTSVGKNVKFQDESDRDKENKPLYTKAEDKINDKPTGLKAKPIRKPAAARASTRTKLDAGKTQIGRESKAEASQPLTPKKIKQIAKATSIGSEDELSGGYPPVRALSLSPKKPPMSPIRITNNGRSDLGWDRNSDSTSSSDTQPNVLGSPPRRPPPSPFKDALKDSPKRVNISDSTIHLDPSVTASAAKASLLQTPAKRFGASPFKPVMIGSASKPDLTSSVLFASSALRPKNPSQLPHFSPQKAINSPLRTARSPEKIPSTDTACISSSGIVTEPTVLEPYILEDPFETSVLGTTTQGTELAEESTVPRGNFQKDQGVEPSPQSTRSMSENEKFVSGHDNAKQELFDAESSDFQEALSHVTAPAFAFPSSAYRDPFDDLDSEDELASTGKPSVLFPSEHFKASSQEINPARTQSSSTKPQTVSTEVERSPIPEGKAEPFSMTPLAVQLSSWLASSPEKNVRGETRIRGRDLFSPMAVVLPPTEVPQPMTVESPPKISFFEDGMVAYEEAKENMLAEHQINHDILAEPRISQELLTSEEYGDENATPVEAQLAMGESEVGEVTMTCTPVKVFYREPLEIHTVSKVPLRPADDESPLKVPRKRSRSVAGPLAIVCSVDSSTSTHPVDGLSAYGNHCADVENEPFRHFAGTSATPKKSVAIGNRTPETGLRSCLETPVRSIGRYVPSNTLKGAVVYVDVHTSEGADASEIFVDLLTHMGARCVKQWVWNPRSSVAVVGDESNPASHDAAACGNKIGITHVVYKDGGRRTLEKVREAKGVVLCVGVGWVLECVFFFFFPMALCC